MQAELEIKSILKENKSAEKMAVNICSFMNWNEVKLVDVIKKHGCSDSEAREKIVSEFWIKPRKQWN